MSEAGVADEVIARYLVEATSADYDHLVATTFDYVDVE
jgi:hypothetical protein